MGEPVGEQEEQDWKVRMDALGPHLYPASQSNGKEMEMVT